MQASGFIAILVAIVLSRFISERGYRELNSDEKLRLMDGFSSTRMYSMVPLLMLVAVFWFLTTQTDLSREVVGTAYFGLLIAYIVLRTVLNQRKLAALEMPTAYRRSFMAAQAISLVGVAWFFFTFLGT
ncbi:hypothetical protein NB063_07160 [Rhodopirellula sp. ICT_H3.1]|uniref:Uncharacterized protein n=2 Tax=Aporhodopirellula aestuarii TaxID=2950107 RepID=A0ABT0U0Q0_9BACT|nr:hypothetical protein [Aporhodopirellula aestuarii]